MDFAYNKYMERLSTLGHLAKFPLLYFKEERKSYSFGIMWAWVKDDNFYFFVWAAPLTHAGQKMEPKNVYPFQTISSFVDFPICRYFKMDVGHTDGSRTRNRTSVTRIGSKMVTLTHSNNTLEKWVDVCVYLVGRRGIYRPCGPEAGWWSCSCLH